MAFKKTVKVLGEGTGTKRKHFEEAHPQRERRRKSPTGPSPHVASPAPESAFDMKDGTNLQELLDGRGPSPVAAPAFLQNFSALLPHGEHVGTVASSPGTSLLSSLTYASQSDPTRTGSTASSVNQFSSPPDGIGSVDDMRSSLLPNQAQLNEDSVPIAASLTNVFHSSSNSSDSEGNR